MADDLVSIDFRNLRRASRTLKQFEPDLRREMFQAIGSALKPVIQDARRLVPDEAPMSGWAKPAKNPQGRPWPLYSAADMRAGFRQNRVMNKRMPNGWVAQAGIKNTNAAAVIYEIAGTINPWGRTTPPARSRNPRAGALMIGLISEQSGLPRRYYKLGVQAVVLNYKDTRRRIEDAIRTAERKFYLRSRVLGTSPRKVA